MMLFARAGAVERVRMRVRSGSVAAVGRAILAIARIRERACEIARKCWTSWMEKVDGVVDLGKSCGN